MVPLYGPLKTPSVSPLLIPYKTQGPILQNHVTEVRDHMGRAHITTRMSRLKNNPRQSSNMQFLLGQVLGRVVE